MKYEVLKLQLPVVLFTSHAVIRVLFDNAFDGGHVGLDILDSVSASILLARLFISLYVCLFPHWIVLRVISNSNFQSYRFVMKHSFPLHKILCNFI
jgi:hypothetical protein